MEAILKYVLFAKAQLTQIAQCLQDLGISQFVCYVKTWAVMMLHPLLGLW